jgi:hypothetical protein
MRILALDPGHTTGVAVLGEEGEVEISMTIRGTIFLQRSGFIQDLVDIAKPETILIEALPTNFVDPLTSEVFHAIHRGFVSHCPFSSILVINPGQWKNMVQRVEIPGQHARDAATMAKWYLTREVSR